MSSRIIASLLAVALFVSHLPQEAAASVARAAGSGRVVRAAVPARGARSAGRPLESPRSVIAQSETPGSAAGSPSAHGSPAPAEDPQAPPTPQVVPVEAPAAASESGLPLDKLYPKVVYIQDVFIQGAQPSEQTIASINKLLDTGVHVVLLTWRPHTGPNSAKEVILSRVKASLDNPLIVVSYNGGRIAAHTRENQPPALIEDSGAFAPNHLATFAQINVRMARALKLPALELANESLPGPDNAFSYRVELPEGLADVELLRERFLKRYNKALQSEGLPFRMAAHPDNPRAIIMHSMPLRFQLDRIREALRTRFYPDQPELPIKPSEVLVLADSKRSPRLSHAFPKLAEFHVVQTPAELEATLGSVFGAELSPVNIHLRKLKQFVEYWQPYRRRVPSPGAGPRAGSGMVEGGGDAMRQLQAFKGTVLNELIPYIYKAIWKGEDRYGQFPEIEALLVRMWKNPMAFRIWMTAQMAQAMKAEAWKKLSPGVMRQAIAFAFNWWNAEFGGRQYPEAAWNVRLNRVSSRGDMNNSITLTLPSRFTRKVYQIHTRLPLVMKAHTAKGVELIVKVLRTGQDYGTDEFFARIFAAAAASTSGFGHIGQDGQWHYMSEIEPKLGGVRVQVVYNRGSKVFNYSPEELFTLEKNPMSAEGWARASAVQRYRVRTGPKTDDVMSVIDIQEADAEFQEYWKENDKPASKSDFKKEKKSKGKKASRKPKAKSSRRGRK
ncbi:MAG: hypothetical protein HY549_03780 [Elusimicrobia bacterium]|nr:hypothetical protein [Elusimicrobiota bacterium]